MSAAGEGDGVMCGKIKEGISVCFVVKVESEVGEELGLVSLLNDWISACFVVGVEALLEDRKLGLLHGLGWDDRKLGQSRKGSEGEGGEGGR